MASSEQNVSIHVLLHGGDYAQHYAYHRTERYGLQTQLHARPDAV